MVVSMVAFCGYVGPRRLVLATWLRRCCQRQYRPFFLRDVGVRSVRQRGVRDHHDGRPNALSIMTQSNRLAVLTSGLGLMSIRSVRDGFTESGSSASAVKTTRVCFSSPCTQVVVQRLRSLSPEASESIPDFDACCVVRG